MLRLTVPGKLSTLWSVLASDLALGMADATKESDAWRALKKYHMVKTILIQPVRSREERRNRGVNMRQKLMFSF